MSASPSARLNREALAKLPASVTAPRFDISTLSTGIVHVGVGAFQRAHLALYTEDAVVAAGGDWGIVGVSLRRPDAAEKLRPQDCLYSVETRGVETQHRVVGVLRDVLTAPAESARVEAALASPSTHIVTLTVTEKGYNLTAEGALDAANPEIAHDLRRAEPPVSTLGWLLRGLERRFHAHRAPLTIMSCDNISANSAKLRAGLLALAHATKSEAAGWIEDAIAFPNTMVDCIVPATDADALARAHAALGVEDAAAVQREAFSQWVIENTFAGPRPAWEAAGAEIVSDVAPYERLKLHILNATHSALAYLGAPRGHLYVRHAIADSELSHLLDELVQMEIAPALAPLDAEGYWRVTKQRFANPSINHSLAQIAEDGSKKIAVRILPLLIDNARAGRPTWRLVQIARAWLDFARTPVKDPQSARLAQWAKAGGSLAAALDDPALFPNPFRDEPNVRAAFMSAA